MTEFSSAALDEHIAELGIRPGARIVVHSRLISYGKIEGGLQTVYDSINRAIGEQGTLVVPTYTMNLRETDVFDRVTTASFGVGAFAEFVRCQSGAVRSSCPIHSHAGIGRSAEILLTGAETKSLGVGSDFDIFHKNNFDLLLLGCSFHEGATFIHHVEAMIGTPYREWINLERLIRENGRERKIIVQYYAKAKNCRLMNNLHPVERELVNSGLTKIVPIRGSSRRSHLVTLDDLERSVRGLLTTDPYSLVFQSENNDT